MFLIGLDWIGLDWIGLDIYCCRYYNNIKICLYYFQF